MEVFYTSPWVPPEWIQAHGLKPRGIWLARDFAAQPLPLAAGVCAFADAALRLAEREEQSAVVFTTHCDQLRRGFDAVDGAASGRVFLFNLPATWQTPVAERIYRDELRRLGRFLIRLGGLAPAPEELAGIVSHYNESRRRLLAAAAACPARAYAEAVGRFHLDGSVRLPAGLSTKGAGVGDVGTGETTDGSFPLTPALSLGEREPRSPSLEHMGHARFAPTPPTILPLPRGEGWGEGEGRARTAAADKSSEAACSHLEIDRAGVRPVRLAVVGGPLPQSQMPLLDAIEKAGGRVVLNATEAGERSLWAETNPEPASVRGAQLLARNYLANCVDVFLRPNTRLYDWLRERLVARQVRGIVLWHYGGCDLWCAEAQPMREAFSLPVLLLEAEDASVQRNVGRVQAFLESLR